MVANGRSVLALPTEIFAYLYSVLIVKHSVVVEILVISINADSA